jgi:hypothetical protein
VLLKEVKTGYPMFRWFVIGHLAEAEEEVVREYPAFANEIRVYRTAWDGDESTIIPFEELLSKVEELMGSDEPSAIDDASETHRIDVGELGTEPSPIGEFGQTGPAGQLEGTGE